MKQDAMRDTQIFYATQDRFLADGEAEAGRACQITSVHTLNTRKPHLPPPLREEIMSKLDELVKRWAFSDEGAIALQNDLRAYIEERFGPLMVDAQINAEVLEEYGLTMSARCTENHLTRAKEE